MRFNTKLALAALVTTASLSPLVHAAGTAAGTDIINTATATFTDPGGTPQTSTSNQTTLRVDEILDVTVASNDAANIPSTTPATNKVLSFTVTNTGNGQETFHLQSNSALTGDQFDPTNTRIYIDNGDNVFNSATDTLYVAGTNDPTLNADANIRIFVVSDIPTGRNNSDVGLASLTAESNTARTTPGLDAAGTAFAGLGTNGGDAVVGSTQAIGSAQKGYAVQQVSSSLTKSQSVLDGFGTTKAIPGAEITYTLVFAATGTGNLTGAQVTDAIPAGTSYVAGSLTLDTASQTDLADTDAGSFGSSQITVNLGTVTAPATHTITFKVKIN